MNHRHSPKSRLITSELPATLTPDSCLLRFPVPDLFHSPTSVLGDQRIVILGENIQYLQILMCSHIS